MYDGGDHDGPRICAGLSIKEIRDKTYAEIKSHDDFSIHFYVLLLYLSWGGYYLFHAFRCFCCASKKGSRKSCCFLSVCQREYYNL